MNILAQDQALLNLELYLATPETLSAPTAAKPQALPAAKPPPLPSTLPVAKPPPPPPTSAPKEAIFNTSESKKRDGEAVTQDEKESEKRPKLAQVVLKSSENIFTFFFSNNKNMIQIPSIKITKEIETKFLYFFGDCISVFNDGKISLNEVFDKAFNKAITFLNVIINMNIKPMVLTIGTNDGIVTDTSCLHITYDFFGSKDTLFLYRSLKMTNIDTFDKQVISIIKNSIAANAVFFSKNIQSLANSAEADAIKAKHDLNTAQENIKKAESDFNTARENAITAYKNATKAKNDLNMAQGNATKAKHDLNMAQENANTAQKNTTINHKKYEDHIRSRENAIKAKGDLNMAQENATKAKRELNMAQENVITTQENVITAQKNFIMVQEKSVVAQKNVTTAHQKLSTTQADATLIKEKAINAAKDATKKTKDAQDTEMITKDKEKINLPKPERLIIFKS